MSLGERIREARLKKGLTQIELAKLLNVSDATINRYERGQRRPDPDMLRRLAEILGVSTDYLLKGGPPSENNIQPRSENTYPLPDDEALEYLDELHKRPEMKALFQVSKKATKEDIETAITIIEALAKKRRPDDF